MNTDIALLAQMIIFALLVWLTRKFVWPPLTRAMEVRQKTITDALAAAERDRLDFEVVQKEAAKRLHQARADAIAALNDANRRAAELIERAETEARLEGVRLAAAAKAQIEHETNRARELLRPELASLALTGAERILERGLDAAADKKLLADFVASLR